MLLYCRTCRTTRGWAGHAEPGEEPCCSKCEHQLIDATHTGEIKVGQTDLGLRWAHNGTYRVMAYVEGGYCCQRFYKMNGWCLFPPHEEMPSEVEQALCAALGIEYIP